MKLTLAMGGSQMNAAVLREYGAKMPVESA